MRPSPLLFGLLALAAMAAQPASAGILRQVSVANYNVTDISDPSLPYDWDKTPVERPANLTSTARGYVLNSSAPLDYFYDPAGKISTSQVVAFNAFGTLSYSLTDFGPGHQLVSEYLAGPGKLPWYGAGTEPPVSDFNKSGQVVGRWYGNEAAATGLEYPLLDDNISDDLHIHLTSADAIDDMGRIIAQGVHDGKAGTYLLTPVGLPVPAPEPSVLAMLGLGGVVFSARAIRRKMVGPTRG